MTTPSLPSVRRYASLAFVFAAAACADKSKSDSVAAGDTAMAATATPPVTSGQSAPGMKGDSGMQGMPGMEMTADADHNFLRMMSDHHKGLVTMAHEAKEAKSAEVIADAKKLDAKQDEELDRMSMMLQSYYKDKYEPKIPPSNQAMIDALKGKTGKDYDRTFHQSVIQHHEEALKMIDDYLPKAKNPTVKAMAEKMKADQTKEIAQFRQKLAKL